MTFDLTTTGVTAGVYGNSSIIPVLTVDERGRLTSVSNVTITTSGGSSTNSVVFVSDTAPSGIANGTLWWNSNDGTLYIYYADTDSSQWVVASPFITTNATSGSSSNSFTTINANGTSIVANSTTDTLTILTTGNVSITADAAGDNITFDLTTTGVTAGVYGNSSTIPVLTVDARGRLTSVSNTTSSGITTGKAIAMAIVFGG